MKTISRIKDSLLCTEFNLVKQIKIDKSILPPPLLPLQPEWYFIFVPYHLNIMNITQVPHFSFGNDQRQQISEEADIDLLLILL